MPQGRVQSVLRRARRFAPLIVDAASWGLALTATLAIRVDLADIPITWRVLAIAIPVAIVLQVLAGYAVGLYQNRWTLGSFEEVAALGGAFAIATVALFVVNLVLPIGADDSTISRPMPASVPLLSGVLAVGCAGTVRYVRRAFRDRRLRPATRTSRPVIVFGAGDAGTQVVTQLLRNPASAFLPVAFLDDDPNKGNLRIRGVPVLGGRDDIARVAGRSGADVLLVAIPSASPALIREVAAAAEGAGLSIRVLPAVDELLDGRATISDIRPLAESELLGREPVKIDETAVRQAIRGRRVLVTGAGGSIGSELCRQVAGFDPADLVMLDRDESALHATQLSIAGHGRVDTPDLVVADLRDRERVEQVFQKVRPEVVFHAAALKHLPLLEMHPGEAVKTNVQGTEHTINAALECGVERFVNISTDKAADPLNVLGYTKRLTERFTAWASRQSDSLFLSVRFGNVLGSRGSILSAFQAQIAAGGPVTVTHPEVTRYFMTVQEAVLLVLQASVLGRGGEVLVLDMGAPIPILRLAERLVAGSRPPVEITFTGLRRGEKLHEAMFGRDEVDDRPLHPLIAQVPVPPLAPTIAHETLDGATDEEIVGRLEALCERTHDGAAPVTGTRSVPSGTP